MLFLKWFAQALKSFKLLFSLFAVGTLFTVGFQYLSTLSFKFIVDDAIAPGRPDVLLVIIALVVGLGIVNLLVGLGCDYIESLTVNRLVMDMRTRLFDHLQKLTPDFYARHEPGELVSRFISHVSNVSGAVSGLLQNVLYQSVALVAGLTILFALEWRLALVCLVGMAVYLIPAKRYAPRSHRLNEAYLIELEKLTAFVEENVQGHRTIRGFNLFDSMRSRMRRMVERMLGLGVQISFTDAKLSRFSFLGMQIVSTAVLGYGGYLGLKGNMSIGSLMAFYATYAPVMTALLAVSAKLPAIIEADASLKRIEDILGERPGLRDTGKRLKLGPIRGGIAIRDTTFGYKPGTPTLKRIHLDIPAGSHVVFVGPSGAGKSTLVQLLIRMHDPEQGEIMYDGLDVRDVAYSTLAGQIGVVFQETTLFNGTIRDNLLLSRPDASEEDIVWASKAAEIHETIADLPQGYDTPLVNGGRNLSGGQRQRLALARAFLRRPRLLILDEPASALDPGTEAAINESIARWHKETGGTIITVTHRLASAARADRIVVLQSGEIVQQGTHGDLLSEEGLYRHMWEKQHGFVASDDGASFKVTADRLAQFDFLRNVPREALEDISNIFVTEKVGGGRTIVEEGEDGDKFYIVVRGRVAILKTQKDGTARQVAVLEDGDHFGEIALLRHIPRTASVVSLSPCVLLSLPSEHFHPLVRKYPQISQSLEQALEARLPKPA